jgi:hypothetical protein
MISPLPSGREHLAPGRIVLYIAGALALAVIVGIIYHPPVFQTSSPNRGLTANGLRQTAHAPWSPAIARPPLAVSRQPSAVSQSVPQGPIALVSQLDTSDAGFGDRTPSPGGSIARATDRVTPSSDVIGNDSTGVSDDDQGDVKAQAQAAEQRLASLGTRAGMGKVKGLVRWLKSLIVGDSLHYSDYALLSYNPADTLGDLDSAMSDLRAHGQANVAGLTPHDSEELFGTDSLGPYVAPGEPAGNPTNIGAQLAQIESLLATAKSESSAKADAAISQLADSVEVDSLLTNFASAQPAENDTPPEPELRRSRR